MQCALCGQLFAALEEETCTKCQKKQGVSAVEADAIDKKPQCVGCGKVFEGLKGPICPGCQFYYASRNDRDIPIFLTSHAEYYNAIESYRETLRMPPPAVIPAAPALVQDELPSTTFSQRFSNSQLSPQVRDLISHASTAQSTASAVRLGSARRSEARPMNANLKKAISSSSVQRERSDMKAVQQGKMIKVIAYLYTRDVSQTGSKGAVMKQALGGTFAKVFPRPEIVEKSLQVLFGEVLESIRDMAKKLPPYLIDLTWEDIQVYAHNGVTPAPTYLPRKITYGNSSTVADLMQFYITNTLGTDSCCRSNTVEIRFVVDFSYEDNFEDPMRLSSRSSHKRSTPQPSLKTTRPTKQVRRSAYAGYRMSASVATFQDPHVDTAASLATASVAADSELWSRNVKMEGHTFTKYVMKLDTHRAKTGWSLVKDEDSMELALIDIACKERWKADRLLVPSKRDIHSGFLGQGGSKFAIYARYNGREYALSFLQSAGDPLNMVSSDAQAFQLGQELILLHEGEHYKELFNEYVEEMKTSSDQQLQFKDFYFNVEDAFIGKFDMESDYAKDGYTCFLATRLLPVGPIHKGVRKFTGNCKAGQPRNIFEEQIHAFVHWTYLYSGRRLVLCDLQGIQDRDKAIALIDPQMHSVDGPQIFWNRRQAGINEFWEDHQKYCRANQYCQYLDLEGLEYQNDDDSEDRDADGDETNLGSSERVESKSMSDSSEEDQLAQSDTDA